MQQKKRGQNFSRIKSDRTGLTSKHRFWYNIKSSCDINLLPNSDGMIEGAVFIRLQASGDWGCFNIGQEIRSYFYEKGNSPRVQIDKNHLSVR